MNLTNGLQVNDNIYEFDVTIKSTDTDFELTSYQCVFNFDWTQLIQSGGSLTFSYIEGTSELSNIPNAGIGVNTGDGIYELAFASSPGSDVITSSPKKVGRFRLQNSNSFNGVNPNPNWNFVGKISTIITGTSFSDITNSAAHINTISTGINHNPEIVDGYKLHQNYPNPFNPSTKIKFALKETGSVKLIIYNLLGEMISKIIDNELPSGTHEIEITSDNLSSGMYIYRLEVANKFVDMKKMTLLK
jgi:hypothetical protein